MNEQREAEIINIRQTCAERLGVKAEITKIETAENGGLRIHWSYDFGYRRRAMKRIETHCTFVFALCGGILAVAATRDYWWFAVLCAPTLGTVAEFVAMPPTRNVTPNDVEELTARTLRSRGFEIEYREDGSSFTYYP